MGAFGSQNLSTNLTDFNTLDFYIDGKLLRINTIKICKISAVNADGTVNVIPMVKNLNGKKEPLPLSELKSFPILRQQGGKSGFIIEYQVGDIVLVGFCDRDPQAVIRSKQEAAPSTYTPFPLSGGIVLGAVLFEDAQIYVKVTDKIYCVGDLDVSLNANIQGNLTVEKNCEVQGNSTIAGNADILSNLTVAGTTSFTGNSTFGGNSEVAGNMNISGTIDAAKYSVGGTDGATLSFTDMNGVTHSVVNGIIVS